MKKIFTFFVFTFFFKGISAQKIESIYFNLYTDSLKKEVFNYINVDAKLTNGKFIPLDTTQIKFSSSYGQWQGNNLFIDSSFSKDSIVVQVFVKADTSIQKSITIYLKKNTQDALLKTEKEVLDALNKQARPKKRKS